MLGCNVTDQLLDQYGFAYAGAAEQTNLTALLVRAEKVNDLNTGLQNLGLCRLLFKSRSFSMDGKILFYLWLGLVVDCIA